MEKWTPVSERMPEVNGEYLVTARTLGYIYVEILRYANDLYKIDSIYFRDKKGIPGWYDYDGGEWGYYEVDGVMAWMPLPKPYKAESEDKE